ncbi:hypothetical protein GCM10023215_08930 [Pseudonocardia yuanmonensis]|uniref:Uncharacterized protein n=1 Tax=Pseudonocardia yuanmonensis TaxID=1095914 RepID=A0ABP8W200_9PSEU
MESGKEQLSDQVAAPLLRVEGIAKRFGVYTELEISSRVQLTRVLFGRTARAEPA